MTQPNKIRIATRNSPLAIWQADYIARLLMQAHPSLTTELIPMTSSGDRFLNEHLIDKGGKGLFVKELEEALLDHQADIAVHSMKDMPAMQPKGLGIIAITERENPLDVFISTKYSGLDNLPLQAKIGTSSLRRQSQLLAIRPDLNITPVRGNIQTRLQKMHTQNMDGIILAAAGLMRMGLDDQITEIISAHIMLPACGQGALGIECRLDDHATIEWVSTLNHAPTACCVNTERYLNALLGGNCHAPIAVFCEIASDHHLHLQAKVLSSDGQVCISASEYNSQAHAHTLAEHCAKVLFSQGVASLLNNH